MAKEAKSGYDGKNLTKQQQACLSLVESLGIYELRAVARVFGDNSPTVSKRDEHIKFIMDKIIAGVDLRPQPVRQGRPYKLLSNIEGILAELSQLTGKDYNFNSSTVSGVQRAQKAVTFKQVDENIYRKKMFPIEVAGSVCESADNGSLYLLNEQNSETILIPRDFILKPYDHVCGTAIMMNSNREYVLDDVKAVNFQNARTYFEKMSPYEYDAIPTETMDFEGATIKLGGRYLINGRLLDRLDKLQKLLKMCNDNGIVTLALVPNVMKDEIDQVKEIGFNSTYILNYDDTPAKIYETFETFTKTIKRLQDQGLKMAVFVGDFYVLADSVDYVYKTNTKVMMGHTELAVEKVKDFVKLASAGGKNKHTTLFTTYDESDMFDQLFVSSVYKVSRKLF